MTIIFERREVDYILGVEYRGRLAGKIKSVEIEYWKLNLLIRDDQLDSEDVVINECRGIMADLIGISPLAIKAHIQQDCRAQQFTVSAYVDIESAIKLWSGK